MSDGSRPRVMPHSSAVQGEHIMSAALASRAGRGSGAACGALPSINTHAATALAAASPAARPATRRNPETNAACIACWMTACISSLTPSGNFRLTKSVLRPTSSDRISEGSGSARTRSARARLNALSMITPKTAMASKEAVRATALLMPEATPARRPSMALITVVVSGATLIVIPALITMTAGKKLVQSCPPLRRARRRAQTPRRQPAGPRRAVPSSRSGRPVLPPIGREGTS